MKSHRNHRTFSEGKLKSQAFQEPYFRGMGLVVLYLVGHAEELQRHVEFFRGLGYIKHIIYELDTDLAEDLQAKKYELYPNDPNIIIRCGDAMDHNFYKEPVDCINFDTMARIEELVAHVLGGYDIALRKMYDHCPVVSLSATARTSDREPVTRLGLWLGLERTVAESIKQQDIMVMFLQKILPEFTFSALSYTGVSNPFTGTGCPMMTIVGVKKE